MVSLLDEEDWVISEGYIAHQERDESEKIENFSGQTKRGREDSRHNCLMAWCILTSAMHSAFSIPSTRGSSKSPSSHVRWRSHIRERAKIYRRSKIFLSPGIFDSL